MRTLKRAGAVMSVCGGVAVAGPTEPICSPEPRPPTPAQVIEGAMANSPAPDGVADLRFTEFFEPIGDFGLEYTQRLRSLDGKRVRIAGFMLLRCTQVPGQFLLTPVPLVHHEREYGLADDLPAATLFVSVPWMRMRPVPHLPGPLVLTGTLSIGTRPEPDGRTSCVRLALDTPAPAEAGAASSSIDPSPTVASAEAGEAVPSPHSPGGNQ